MQTGGGVRTVDDAEALADAGVARVVMGSAAVRDPALVDEVAAVVPVAVGLDHRGGEIAVHGWTEASGVQLADALGRVPGGGGVRDHRHRPRRPARRARRRRARRRRRRDRRAGDRQRRRRRRSTTSARSPAIDGLHGIITGRALYEGRFTVAEAVGVLRVIVARVIPCLDVTDGRVVKGTNFVDLRDAGDPVELAARYDAEGADELVFLDITASSDGRDTMVDVVVPHRRAGVHPVHRRRRHPHASRTPGGCCAPAPTRSASTPPRSQRPELIAEIATEFGAQCVVCAIDAKRRADGPASRCTSTAGARRPASTPSRGRPTPPARGAGEILLTSMDRDGTKDGFDLELTRAVGDAVGVPVDRQRRRRHARAPRRRHHEGGADAVLAASIFHFGEHTIAEAKAVMAARGITVRTA